jgi:LDH2 family malate/lactate/ureidoglycolate dehydrogenase
MKKAKARGAHSVSFRNSNHIGRLGYYGEIAARKGLLFFMVANVLPGNRVSHPESKKGIIGTNPVCLAFKWKGRLILVDTSTSAAAEGKIAILRAKGHRAPKGILRDHRGKMSIDPRVLYKEPKGSLWPLGGAESGYKGFALGVFVDMLAGLSSGGGLSGAVTPPGANCGFMHVIDYSRFLSKRRVDEMMSVWTGRMHAAAKDSGIRSLTLPGEPEMRSKKHNRTHGILINGGSWRELEALAEKYGVYI